MLKAATSACVQQVASVQKGGAPDCALCLLQTSHLTCHYHRTTHYSCRSHDGAVKAFTTELITLYAVVRIVSRCTTSWKAFFFLKGLAGFLVQAGLQVYAIRIWALASSILSTVCVALAQFPEGAPEALLQSLQAGAILQEFPSSRKFRPRSHWTKLFA